jgi:GMP synthase-like glutamine amidotransferase
MQKGKGTVRLQQHHRRGVGTPPRGFHELLVGNQAFLSHDRTILTMQGHPEKDAQCAKLRVRDATRWFGVSEDDKAALLRIEKSMDREHDGPEVWERIFEWTREEHPSYGVHL